MAPQEFTLKTYLFVDPPTLSSRAAADIRDLCTLNSSIMELHPTVRVVGTSGRIEIIFNFTADSLESAEQIATDTLNSLLEVVNGKKSSNHYREGSNLLSLA